MPGRGRYRVWRTARARTVEGAARGVASGPGSVDLHHAESEAIGSIEGPSPPFVTDVVGVDADPAEVMAFYGDELPKASWAPDVRDPARVPTTVETDIAVWLKGDVIIRVSILRKDDPRVPGSERAAEFQTFYQVTILPASPWGGSPSHASGRGKEIGDGRSDSVRLLEVGEVAAVIEHDQA